MFFDLKTGSVVTVFFPDRRLRTSRIVEAYQRLAPASIRWTRFRFEDNGLRAGNSITSLVGRVKQPKMPTEAQKAARLEGVVLTFLETFKVRDGEESSRQKANCLLTPVMS